jgi:hypothetical protein
MDLATLAGIGTLVTATLGSIGFFIAQGANLHKLIESGDDAVREDESRARHKLAAMTQRASDELRRDVETLKRETFRRDEAREMEVRLTTAMARIETKVDRHTDQMAEMMSLKGSLNSCIEQVKGLAGRLVGGKA